MIKVVFFDIGDTLVHRNEWMPGAKEIVQILAASKIRIGLMSNTGNMMRDELVQRLPKDFDFGMFEEGLVLLSSEVGIEKPSLSIFLLAIQHAKVSPWETMFVAETLTETLAAQKAGMHGARILDSAKDYPQLLKLLNEQ